MKKINKTISIIGCGWLGLPLGEILNEQGWKVKGTTTKNEKVSELKSVGIEPYVIQFPRSKQVEEPVFQSHNLLINLPPGRNNPEILQKYPITVNQILSEAVSSKTVSKIIFISSTSVYGNSADMIDEKTDVLPETDSGKVILEAEQLVSECGIPSVILRFGGLAGPGRHPGRFLAGRKGLEVGGQSVNFLHLDDALGIIQYFLHHPVSDQCFNVVSPGHPSKKDFYTKMALSIGFDPPTFSIPRTEVRKKEISVDKLLKETKYKFIHPDPMDFTF